MQATEAVRDVIADNVSEDEKEKEKKEGETPLPQPVIQIVQLPSNRSDPTIDEPVTGNGNDALWIPPVPTPSPKP